jgi:4-diphosphocytidyl-2-C-methyl-D-erythritol kinase
MTVATGLAPAKLNLFLHILGRRPDGYHELQTVFELVDLCDEVRIEATADGRIERSPPPSDPLLAGLTDDQDLTVRAARLLQRECKGSQPGARIHVIKRIPAGGGLGGGSSDAATTLRLLNRLWHLELPLTDLAALGGELGADVPVFVLGRSAWAEGRGERLTAVELPPAWYVIVDPGVAVSTAAVFAHPELTRDSPPLTMRGLGTAPTRNDCEPVVRMAYPAVAAALDDLRRYAEARLTGTGGCVFAKFRTEAEARDVARQVHAARSVFVVRSLPTADC